MYCVGKATLFLTTMVWFCKLENKEKVDEVTVGGESPSAMTFRHSN